jgi:hypothetical protein
VPGPNDIANFTAAGNGRDVACNIDANAPASVRSIRIRADYTQQITLQRDITVDDTRQFGGRISGPFNYIVPANGDYDWHGGSLGGGGPNAVTLVQANARIYIAPVVLQISGRKLDNFGQINWNPTPQGAGLDATLNLIDDAAVINEQNATMNMPSGAQYTLGSPDTTGQFTSSGIMNITGGSRTFITASMTGSATATYNFDAAQMPLVATLSMSGGVTFAGGRMTGIGQMILTGIASVTADTNFGDVIAKAAFLTVTATFRANLTLSNADVDGLGVGVILAGGNNTITLQDGVIFSGITVRDQSGILPSAIKWMSGDITLQDNTAIDNQQLFEVNGAADLTMTSDGTCGFTNSGAFDQHASGVVTIPTCVNNKPTGSITLFAGVLQTPGDWSIPGGTMTFQGGSLRVPGTFTIGGTVNIAANFTSATIEAFQVLNAGTIDLSSDTPQTLYIVAAPGQPQGGHYDQSSSGSLLLCVTGDGATNQINGESDMFLAGSLTVTLRAGYQPGLAQTWALLITDVGVGSTYDSANVSLPAGFTIGSANPGILLQN